MKTAFSPHVSTQRDFNEQFSLHLCVSALKYALNRNLFPALLALLPFAGRAIDVEWIVDAATPRQFDFSAFHGESLSLAAHFPSNTVFNGSPLLYYQTNGMDNLWWTAPASSTGTTLRATFSPAMDPGAATLFGFIGIPGETYRAAFRARLLGSPGANPNALPLPVESLDFSAVAWTNAPWATTNDLAEAIAAVPSPDLSPYATTNALALKADARIVVTPAATNITIESSSDPRWANHVGESLVFDPANAWWTASGLYLRRADGWEYTAYPDEEWYSTAPMYGEEGTWIYCDNLGVDLFYVERRATTANAVYSNDLAPYATTNYVDAATNAIQILVLNTNAYLVVSNETLAAYFVPTNGADEAVFVWDARSGRATFDLHSSQI